MIYGRGLHPRRAACCVRAACQHCACRALDPRPPRPAVTAAEPARRRPATKGPPEPSGLRVTGVICSIGSQNKTFPAPRDNAQNMAHLANGKRLESRQSPCSPLRDPPWRPRPIAEVLTPLESIFEGGKSERKGDGDAEISAITQAARHGNERGGIFRRERLAAQRPNFDVKPTRDLFPLLSLSLHRSVHSACACRRGKPPCLLMPAWAGN